MEMTFSVFIPYMVSTCFKSLPSYVLFRDYTFAHQGNATSMAQVLCVIKKLNPMIITLSSVVFRSESMQLLTGVSDRKGLLESKLKLSTLCHPQYSIHSPSSSWDCSNSDKPAKERLVPQWVHAPQSVPGMFSLSCIDLLP